MGKQTVVLPQRTAIGAAHRDAMPATASLRPEHGPAMRFPLRPLLLACLPLATAIAQVPGALLTFSQTENTISMGGGPLQVLRPNEIAFLPLPPGCPNGARTEKWSPRTCFHVMAGDENGNGQYWNPNLFGSIDALSTGFTSNNQQIAPNPRAVYWSPSAAMGTNISGQPQLRPGDIGRILVDGTVELLMSQDQFKAALGLGPLDPPIDIDAFAYEPGLGVYFSIDSPAPVLAQLACVPGWSVIQDGDLFAIPAYAITFALNQLVAGVWPISAYRVKTEADFDAMLANSQIGDRNGVAITSAGDLESLDIYHGPGSQITMFNSCINPVPVPDFLFSTSTMTGGSLACTIGGGQPAMGPCGFLGIPAQYGLQTGAAVGIQQQLASVGPASYVNALAFGTTERFVLEPVAHQLNYGLLGGPPTVVHVGGNFDYVFTWVDLAPSTIAPSVTLAQNLFPDWYCLNLLLWDFGSAGSGFHSFATPNIPINWSGKLIFQSIGFDAACTNCPLNLSTPCVIDVN